MPGSLCPWAHLPHSQGLYHESIRTFTCSPHEPTIDDLNIMILHERIKEKRSPIKLQFYLHPFPSKTIRKLRFHRVFHKLLLRKKNSLTRHSNIWNQSSQEKKKTCLQSSSFMVLPLSLNHSISQVPFQAYKLVIQKATVFHDLKFCNVKEFFLL